MGRNDKFITSGPVEDFSFAEVLEVVQKPIRAKTSLDLTMSTGLGALRFADNVVALVRQRDASYSDGKPLSVSGNLARVATLGFISFGLWVHGSELARRKRDAQSPASLEQAPQKADVSDLVPEAVGLGMYVAQVKNGHTLFQKRQLSTYGRTFMAASAAVTALRLGLLVRSVVK